jgi:hypothetical protein
MADYNSYSGSFAYLQNPEFLIDFTIDSSSGTAVFFTGKGRLAPAGMASAVEGATLTSPVQIIEDLLRRGLGYTNIDTGSFASMQVSRASWSIRVCEKKELLYRDIINNICLQTGIILSESPSGSLRLTDSFPQASIRTYLDSDLVLSNGRTDWGEEISSLNNVVTDVYFQAFENPAKENAYFISSSYVAEPELTVGLKKQVNLKLKYIIDVTYGRILARNIALYYARPRRTLTITLPITEYVRNIGDWVDIDSNTVRHTSGNTYLVVGKKVSVSRMTTTLKLLEFRGDEIEGDIYEEYSSNPSGDWQEVTTGTDTVQEVS